MSRRIEIATFRIELKKEEGEMAHAFPRMEFLQDNLQEVMPLIPDGHYRWTLTMTLDNAEQVQPE